MAGGPIAPFSAFPTDTSGRLFPNFHVNSTGDSHMGGMGVEASLDSTAIWRMLFRAPQTLPSGTAKFVLQVISNATSGKVVFTPNWKSYAVGEQVMSTALFSEGTTADSVTGVSSTGTTAAWDTGDDHTLGEVKWNLDADTVVAGETIAMDLHCNSTGWTLASVLTFNAFVVWE